jgi:hypothetical protein
MLYNLRYSGIIEWGEYRSAYRRGTRARERQPVESILRADRPDLRIVDAKLWEAVQERLQAVRRTYIRDNNGHTWGRPGIGVESRYLLTGLGECGCCGRNISMPGGQSGAPGKRKPLRYYGCSYRVFRGRSICSNDLKACMEDADGAMLEAARARVLTPAAIDYTVDQALRMLAERQRADTDAPKRLRTQIKRERQQLENLVRSLEEGGRDEKPRSLVKRIAELEASIAAQERKLSVLEAVSVTELEVARLKRALRI